MAIGRLQRYLAREIYLSIAFVLLAFVALFLFFDLINQLDDVGEGGLQLWHAALIVLGELPGHVYQLMPIAALIGAIYALAQFAQHSEFTAMRAAGFGRRHGLALMVRIGLVLAAATALVGEGLAPPAKKLAQQMRLSALGSSPTAVQFRSGLWIKDTLRGADGAIERQRFVNIRELRTDTTLAGVRVLEFDADFRLREFVRAQSARYVDGSGWTLEKVRVTSLAAAEGGDRGGDGDAAIGFVDREVDALPWRSDLTPALLGVLIVDPERMTAWSLASYVRHLRLNRQNTDRYELALWNKFTYPFVAVVMLMLALPFGYLQARSGGIAYKVFAGVMLGVAFHFLNGLSSHLGLLNTWPAWTSVVLPSAVALLLAFAMLSWVDRTR